MQDFFLHYQAAAANAYMNTPRRIITWHLPGPALLLPSAAYESTVRISRWEAQQPISAREVRARNYAPLPPSRRGQDGPSPSCPPPLPLPLPPFRSPLSQAMGTGWPSPSSPLTLPPPLPTSPSPSQAKGIKLTNDQYFDDLTDITNISTAVRPVVYYHTSVVGRRIQSITHTSTNFNSNLFINMAK